MNRLALFAIAPFAGLASAHEGHGIAALSHWHATDVPGWVALAAAAVVAAWWAGRR